MNAVDVTKKRLGIKGNAQDELVESLLDAARAAIVLRVYPYDETQSEVPERYIGAQVEIAVYLYNKQGAEGQTRHAEGGINRYYESANIPNDYFKGITPYVGVLPR